MIRCFDTLDWFIYVCMQVGIIVTWEHVKLWWRSRQPHE